MINKLSHSPKALNHLNHRLAQIADQGHGAVKQRLSQLESEWLIGRLVQAMNGVLLLASALRVLRGDFRFLPTLHNIEERDAIARLEGEGGTAFEPDAEKYDAKEAASVILEGTLPLKMAVHQALKTAA